MGDITAQRLQGGLRKLAQTVGTEGDGVDYYRFTLSEAREVRLGLKLRQGEAELSVEDAEGNVLARSMAYAGYEVAVRTLLPGTYYVRVEAVGAAASEYEFRYGVLEANASFRPASDSPWHTGLAEKMGMPSFGEAGYGFELSETADGSVSGVLLGTVLAVDPNGEELSYGIVGGNGSGLFALGGASGELSYVGAGEDFEGGAGPYELTIRASDGTHTIDTTVTVTVTDAAEQPAFGDGSYAFELAENADGRANGLSLGRVLATDPDGDEVRYSLTGGNESMLFNIDETSGELYYVGPGEDYESGVTSYELTVRASDAAHTVDTTVTVTVTDEAEAPAFGEESYAFELAENVDGRVNGISLGTVTATDPDSDTVRYSLLGGNDSSLFAIEETSGELFYVGAGEDFEGGVTSYELTVRASDAAHTVDTTVTVTVTDEAEAPAFGEESYAFELAENVDGRVNRLSLGTVTATDPDSDTVRYSLLDGNDSSLFAIEETSGELFYVGAGEDFEGGVTSYELTVRASDGTHTIDTTVTVTVTDAAEQPAFGDGSYAFELAENADGRANGLSLGRVTATDPDGDEVRYSLTGGNESRLFNIDAASGELYYVGPGEDFEGGVTSYELTVRASDAAHTVDTTVTVTVTDEADAPAFGEESYAFELAENVDGRVNRLSLGSVTATDPDSDGVRYSLLGGNDSSLFAIEETSGELFYVGAGEDFEGGVTSYELTVRASDGTHTIDTTVTVTVTDAAEQPAFGEESYAFELAENADGRANRLSLGRVLATDPDGDAVRYSLTGGNESMLFNIDAASGELYYVGPGEDYESGVTSYELTVRASDAAHTVDTTVMVTVTDAGEAPAFGEESYAFELAENVDGSVNRISLGLVAATDPDSDTVRYSLLVGNDSSLFAIEETSGELYYVGAGEDFEGGVTSYELTIRASDGTHTIDTTVTVTVTDAAEQPAFGDESYAFELAENADGRANGLSLGRVLATDPDGDEVRYSLTGGNESMLFTVDAASGELYYVGPGEDYESGVTSYELTIRASDGTHTIDTTVTVTVTDAAEQPAFGEGSYAFELAENADGRANGLSLGRVLATDPDGDEVRYSLTGGNELFTVDETSGELYYVGPGEDYESGVTSYEVTVRASDAAHTVDTTVTVTVTDAAEAPAFGEESYAFELAENVDGRVNRISLGAVTATDPDSDAVRYSLVGGNDSSLFAIGETSGELYYVGLGEDYESGVTSYELTVRASDGTHTIDTTVTVTVTDAAEAPAFGEESYAFELAENADGRANRLSLGRVLATDPDGDAVRYSLTGGNESRLFNIDAASGELYYVGPGEDYESGVTSYEVTLRASDAAHTVDTTVMVTVTDAGEAPAFAEESYAFELAENVDGRVNRLSLGTVTATDPDSDTVRYSLLVGNDSSLFAIEETSGELFYVGAGEDFEGGVTSYELTIRASDGTHTIDTTVTVTVTDAAEQPAFGEESYAFELAENADGRANGLSLGRVLATDPDGDEVRYSLTGGNELFTVDETSGELYYVGPGEDYESGVTSYEVTVRASDAAHTVDTTVTVTVTDEAEAPAFGEESYAFELAENVDGRVNRLSLGTVTATDPDSDTVRYSLLVGNDSSLFAINETSGELFYVGAGEDFEGGVTSYELTIRASDGTHTIDTTVTVTVTDAAEQPAFGEESYAFELAENADGRANGLSLGRVLATDPDGDAVRYSLTGGNESRLFNIDAASGELYYVGPGEDYESGVTSYELTVRASDAAHTVDTTVTVTVTDAAEAPAFGEESYAFELAENVDGRVNRLSLGSVTATDPDGNAVRYSLLVGNDSSLFAIEETSGELFYVGAGEDYEGGAGPHELTVRASDGTHTIDTTVTVTITDAAEAPAFGEESYAFALSENADGSVNRLSLGTVEATDPDGDAVRYSLAGGNDSVLFAIDETSGELYYGGPGEDYESGVTSYELTVRASDGTHAADTPVTVTVTDAADAPLFAEESYAFALSENTDGSVNRLSLGTVTATDPDGDAVRYSLAGGNESRRFAIGETSGELYYVGLGEDYESGVTSYELTVQASDGTHASDTTVTVALGDVRGHSEPEGGDLPNDRTTPGMVLVDEGAVTGNIEMWWDLDWFAVELVAGRTYQIDFRGQPTGDGTLVDPSLYGVFDGDGRLIPGTTIPDGGTSHNSRLVFTAPGEGTYYIATSGNGTYPSGTGTYELEVRDVRAPVFAEAGYRFALSENAEGSVNRQSLGTVTATDPDGGTVRYRLVGGDESRRFAIDPDTGEVFYVGPGEDYESGVTSHELTVRASDGAYSTEVSVTVTVTDVAEAPEFSEESYAFELAENVDGSDERLSLGVVEAVDPDGDSVHYSLAGGNASDLFAIDAASGELYYVGSGEDFESGVTSYELTVGASDGAYSTEVTVTVTVTDDAEAPAFSEESYAFALAENANGSVNRLSLGAVLATDPDGDAVRYSLAGGNVSDLFAINEASGEIYYVGPGEDFESGTGPYELTVRASDGAYSAEVTVTVTVTDAPEAPAFGEESYAFELAENVDGSDERLSLGVVEAVDPDGDSVHYSLAGGNASDLFAIDAASGELYYVGSGEDFESGVTSYELTVGASDGAYSTEVTVTVTVTDDAEAPAFEEERYAFALAENTDGSDNRLALGAVTATDPDGDAVRYSLSGGKETRLFAIGETSGELYYVGGGEDDESGATTYELTVQASDGAHTVDTMVTVTVVDNPFDSEKSTGPQGSSEPASEDLPAGRETSGEVRVGAEPVDGTLRSPSDRDWFAVTLAPGRTYVFALEGDTPRGGTGAAPAIRGLRDANGNPVAGIAGGTEVRYATDAAAAEAVYYIEVGGEGGSGQGTSATRGVGARSLATRGIVDTLGSSDGGTGYRLRAHDITETRDAADDYRSDTSTTGVVTVGGSVTGEIERSGDRDWFAVDLEAGRIYRIDLKGRSTGDGTLHNPYLRGVYDDKGVLIRGTGDDDRGAGRNSRADFVAPADATYYLAASSYRDWKGTYTLSVTEVHDDFPAGTGTSGTVEVGDSATGEIEFRGDHDWFEVTLQAGKVYRFDLKGEPTGDGTLPHPYIRGIYDADGDRIDGMSGAYSNFGSNPRYSRMDFVAPADDTYYVSAEATYNGYWWRGGTYTLSVTEVTDDYASGIGTTGTLAVGDSTTGAIDYMDDRDWFAVTLQAGKSYRFDLEGYRSDAGTLDTPKIHGIFDSHGNEIDGARVTHGWFQFYSQAVFTPDADDTYFVSAGKWWYLLGTYTLTVTEIVDDYPDDTSTTGRVTVGGSTTGFVDHAEDLDWFAVTLEADTTYRLNVNGDASSRGRGFLYEAQLRGVYDSNGDLIAGTESTGFRESLDFKADAPGTYYLSAGTPMPHYGTYTLSVEEVTDGM